MKKNTFTKKENIWNIIGVIAGLAAIVIGVIIYINNYYRSFTVNNYKFGADFYTEMYYAVYNADYGLTKIYELLVEGLSFIISFSGLITAILFARRITKNINSVSVSEKNPQDELTAKTASVENSLEISNDNLTGEKQISTPEAANTEKDQISE